MCIRDRYMGIYFSIPIQMSRPSKTLQVKKAEEIDDLMAEDEHEEVIKHMSLSKQAKTISFSVTNPKSSNGSQPYEGPIKTSVYEELPSNVDTQQAEKRPHMVAIPLNRISTGKRNEDEDQDRNLQLGIKMSSEMLSKKREEAMIKYLSNKQSSTTSKAEKNDPTSWNKLKIGVHSKFKYKSEGKLTNNIRRSSVSDHDKSMDRNIQFVNDLAAPNIKAGLFQKRSNEHGILRRSSKRPGSLLWRKACLLYTSPSPRDRQKSRMPSSA
eukprot:TRINITY_DN15534_c0_g1_i2.p1 TRINITY_DN15534_c0_g1~~TRINITY_DN15534_c0_g1_i2.p1  ORF type:complete len:268 (+),score=42.30 TRINITY_DN15534_c0_g1_i2:64-867(+)